MSQLSRIKVGVFQIATHPAVVLAERDLLEEPIAFSQPGLGLTHAARVCRPLRLCGEQVRRAYIEWHRERLNHLLGWLTAQATHPDIVVFPECSIPYECLEPFYAIAKQHGITFFAGTHTPLTSAQAKTFYKKGLGVTSSNLRDVFEQVPPAVLPIIGPNGTALHIKSAASIFETTESVTSPKTPVQVQTTVVVVGNTEVHIAPLICAEALQLLSYSEKPELAVVVARERQPARFNPVIQTLVGNNCPVVVANDAMFGASGIFCAVDERRGGWWFNAPNNGRLPKGECYVEVEVDLNVRAVEVGVAAPREPAQLTKLVPVLSADDPLLDAERAARSAADACDVPRLQGLSLDTKLPVGLSPIVMDRWDLVGELIRKQTLTPRWLEITGDHIHTAGVCGLKSLEGTLCAIAHTGVKKELESDSVNSLSFEEVGKLHFLEKSLADRLPAVPRDLPMTPAIVQLPIGRNEILPELRTFFGKGSEPIMILTGLEAVGKSTVVGTATQQVSARTLRITCQPGGSADVVYELLLRACGRVAPGIAPRNDFALADLAEAIKSFDVVWIENAQNLLEYGKFRTSQIESLVNSLVLARQNTSTRLVFESRRSIPITCPMGVQVARKRLGGLAHPDAVGFFDQQLLRNGIPLETVALEDRKAIALAVDGHPGMLALCADACEKIGVSGVLTELRGRRGFYWEAVRKLLDSLKMSQRSLQYIELLALCRMSVPEEALRLGDDHSETLTELHGACIVERDRSNTIRLTALFSELALSDSSLTDAQIRTFNRRASEYFVGLSRSDDSSIALRAGIEANYHAILGGIAKPCDDIGLKDSISAVAKRHYEAQQYKQVLFLLGPENPDSLSEDLAVMLAESYAWCDKFNEAFSLAERVVARNRNHSRIFVDICDAALHSHRREHANAAIERAASYEPGSYLVALYRGRLIEKRDIDAAIDFFRESAEKTDRDAWPFFYLSRALIQRGLPEEALAAIDSARKLLDGQASGRRARGIERALLSQEALALVLTNDHEHAQLVLGVLENSPNPRPEQVVLTAYLRAYYDAEHGDSTAMRAFETALNRMSSDDSRKAHNRAQMALFRGKLLEKLGDLGRAETEYSKACELDSHNVHMKECLLNVLRSIEGEATKSQNANAALSAARRAFDVAKQVTSYDSNHKQALYALEDYHRRFKLE